MTDFKSKLNNHQANNRLGKRINLKTINIGLFSLVFMLGFAYVVCINDLTVRGFALSDFKGQLNTLTNENQEIDAKIMATQSYNSLISKVKDLNMVAVENVDYLTINNPLVAKK